MPCKSATPIGSTRRCHDSLRPSIWDGDKLNLEPSDIPASFIPNHGSEVGYRKPILYAFATTLCSKK